jgi:hypothetical protein
LKKYHPLAEVAWALGTVRHLQVEVTPGVAGHFSR